MNIETSLSSSISCVLFAMQRHESFVGIRARNSGITHSTDQNHNLMQSMLDIKCKACYAKHAKYTFEGDS